MPGVSASRKGRAKGTNDSKVFHWRGQYLDKAVLRETDCVGGVGELFDTCDLCIVSRRLSYRGREGWTAWRDVRPMPSSSKPLRSRVPWEPPQGMKQLGLLKSQEGTLRLSALSLQTGIACTTSRTMQYHHDSAKENLAK